MLFGFELDRRLRAAGQHDPERGDPPGALDSLTPARPPVRTRTTGERLRGLPASVFLHDKDAAARAAAVLDPSVTGGQL
jgi:hypothetical protein